MAIVEVKMVSGWAATPSSLKQLLKDNVAQLKRYEVDPNGAVQLYFEPVSICLFTFGDLFAVNMECLQKYSLKMFHISGVHFGKFVNIVSNFWLLSSPPQ